MKSISTLRKMLEASHIHILRKIQVQISATSTVLRTQCLADSIDIILRDNGFNFERMNAKLSMRI